MKNKILLKIANISGWILLLILIFYFISGYAMVHEYGFDRLMHKSSAWGLHKYMTLPFLIALVLHIVPYYVVRKQVKRLIYIIGIIIALSIFGSYIIDKTLQNDCLIKLGQKEKSL